MFGRTSPWRLQAGDVPLLHVRAVSGRAREGVGRGRVLAAGECGPWVQAGDVAGRGGYGPLKALALKGAGYGRCGRWMVGAASGAGQATDR